MFRERLFPLGAKDGLLAVGPRPILKKGEVEWAFGKEYKRTGGRREEKLDLGQAEARNQKFHPGDTHEWQGRKWSHRHCLPSCA